MTGNERRQIRELVSAMCDRPLSDEEVNQLESLLSSSEGALEETVRLLEINADLAQPSFPINEALSISGTLADAVNACELARPQDKRLDTVTKSKRFVWFFAALAATLLVACSSVATWYIARGSGTEQGLALIHKTNEGTNRDDGNTVGEQFAAKIVRKVDCDWQDDRWDISNSAEILPEQTLSMNQGLMEIEFASGARVTLQGPSSLTVVSPMTAILDHGRLTATVPESAKGFKVHTPGGEAVDLGTRFGLMVGEDGLTQAHVFEGEVVVHDDSKLESNPDGILLTENMAYQFGSSIESTNISADPRSFIDLKFSPSEIPIEVPSVSDDLVMWLTAEHNIQVDSAQRVAGWRDASINHYAEPVTAWQVRPSNRPKLVPGAFNSKPGLQFNGKSYLVTDPLEMTADCTSCVVFKFNAKAVERHKTSWPQGYQLLNFNSPSTMVMRMNKDHHISAFMYAGVTRRDDGSDSHDKSGITWSSKLEEKVPHVAIYVNDKSASTARLYIDGELVAEKPSDVGKTTEAPRFIGSHNHMKRPRFVGHMAELLIYKAALTNDEALSLSNSLMEKYGIPR